MHRLMVPRGLALLAAVLFLPLAGQARAAGSGTPRLLLHVRAVSTKDPCSPGIARCGEAIVQGALYAPNRHGIYYTYLLASGYDTEAGASEIRTGISYDFTTLSGVDIFSWTLCAAGQNPTAAWFQAGGENWISWDQMDAPHDSLAVAGYFYMTAYTPGQLALTPCAAGPATVASFGEAPVPVDSIGLGIVGFGGSDGCNPCLTPCTYTAVQVTTWGGIKTLFRTR